MTQAATTFSHNAVMLDEVLVILAPAAGKVFIDATLGGAGHTAALLAAGATVYGLDQDPYALARNRQRQANGELSGLQIIEGNFRDLATLLPSDLPANSIDGVLFDLGVSSFQLDDGERGFSYHHSAPLDMRMSQSGESAADVVNSLDVADLAAILYEFGEERHSRRIARAIIEARPITTTLQLSHVIKAAYPGGHARGIHPARRSFQALRIYVNDELGALSAGLAASSKVLRPGGVLAVLSFHSLEDRVVKRFMRGDAGFVALSKKPIVASDSEIEANPRARSAKLRAAQWQASPQTAGETQYD
jgi:16S rRNA (cytosine1402-N4)-methyltransferase